MSFIQKPFFCGCYLLVFYPLHAQTDSLGTNDSLMDCTTGFFERAQKIESPDKMMLVTRQGKTISLSNFLKAGSMGDQSEKALIDLDGDGKSELVINNFTGGAHCCDEFYFFKNVAPNKYQFAAKTFAGDVCVTEKNEFLFNFYQQFGYFFTCFACAYEDTTEAGPIPLTNIVFKYIKGKLVVVRGDQELKSLITDNLGKLKELPYQALENEIDQDNGLRKEFAMNLAVFHYSFGRNLIETKKLFDKYYRYPDAKKVWTAFIKQIQEIRKENDF